MVSLENTNVTDEESELINAVLVEFLGEEGGIDMSKGYDFKMQLAKEGLEDVKKANSTLKQRIDSLRFATGNMELVSDTEKHCDELIASLEARLKDYKHLDYGKFKVDTRATLAVVRTSITEVDSQLNNMMEDDNMNNQVEVVNNAEVAATEVAEVVTSDVVTEAVEVTAEQAVPSKTVESDTITKEVKVVTAAELSEEIHNVTPEAMASQATDSNKIMEDKDMEDLTRSEEVMKQKLINEAIDEAIEGTEDFSEDDFDDEINDEELTEEDTVKITQKIMDHLNDLKDFIPVIGDNLERIRHMTYTDAYHFIRHSCIRYMILFKNKKGVRKATEAVKKGFGYIKGLFVKLIRKVGGKKSDAILENIGKVNAFIGETIKKVAGLILDGVLLVGVIAIKVTYSLVSLAFRSVKKFINKGKKETLDDFEETEDDFDDEEDLIKAATDAVLADMK